jgi:tocopherol O-methyltransferase
LTKDSHLQSIETYYRECENAYRDAWGMDQNKQLNLGLWENGANSLTKALIQLNKSIAELAEVTTESNILDAGCGVGGTAIYMAKNYKANVKGITISPEQLALANKNATNEHLEKLIHFDLGDYNKCPYPDESFDVIFGIESICYAEPKIDFLKEAYRLLKKGGRLVLAENLQGKGILNEKKRKILYDYGFNGCNVISLDTKEEYLNNLKEVGFKEAICIDKSKEVRPSIRRLRRFYYAAWAYNKWHEIIGKKFSSTQIANTKMCYYLLSGLDKGLWKYGLIKAIK